MIHFHASPPSFTILLRCVASTGRVIKNILWEEKERTGCSPVKVDSHMLSCVLLYILQDSVQPKPPHPPLHWSTLYCLQELHNRAEVLPCIWED